MSNIESTLKPSKVAVIGGGNIGTQFACICASLGYEVSIYSQRAAGFDNELEIINDDNEIIYGKIALVTSDIGEAIKDCQIVFVTHPAFMLKETAEKMLPHVSADMNICIVPGTGGAEFAFRECINKGAVLSGLQRVPSVARLEKYGKRVRMEGLRDKLFVASLPGNKAKITADFLTRLFGIPCEILPNYLSVTLTPSNPILHTTRLCTMFSDYKEGVVYEKNPLFYGEWDDASSALLLACDEELQQICKSIPDIDLTNVRSLKLHYESDSVYAMTKKISSIKSLHNLRSPMIKIEGGWIPDFGSRYFTADFPYGLAIIEELADMIGEKATNIRKTMNWYRKVTGDANRFLFEDYGVHNINDLCALYED